MKAFFIGLLFLLAAAILSGIGFLLFPVFIVLGWLLRFLFMLGFVILAIWLLGKLIILVWDVIIKK